MSIEQNRIDLLNSPKGNQFQTHPRGVLAVQRALGTGPFALLDTDEDKRSAAKNAQSEMFFVMVTYAQTVLQTDKVKFRRGKKDVEVKFIYLRLRYLLGVTTEQEDVDLGNLVKEYLEFFQVTKFFGQNPGFFRNERTKNISLDKLEDRLEAQLSN